jgi:perosamine synthetase
VLIPANAYVSAASAALQCELVPVFVDIDPETWVMAAIDLDRKVTTRTRVVVPVHMYGQPCDMDAVEAFAARQGLVIIEDAAASHGAVWRGRPIGSFGLLSCFSVCCFKLVSSGEGGVVVTDDADLASRCRMLAHKGKGEGFFDYRMPGYSYHMSELQAAVAHATLSDITSQLEERTLNAGTLRAGLLELGFTMQPPAPHTTHGLFKFPAVLPPTWQIDVEGAVALLREQGVPVVPAHPYLLDIEWLRERNHSTFRNLKIAGANYERASCPNADALVRRTLTVDVGPGLDTTDMRLIVDTFRRVDAQLRAQRPVPEANGRLSRDAKGAV